jgi:hypothetical protein
MSTCFLNLDPPETDALVINPPQADHKMQRNNNQDPKNERKKIR